MVAETCRGSSLVRSLGRWPQANWGGISDGCRRAGVQGHRISPWDGDCRHVELQMFGRDAVIGV
jgi:hypothetical protein